jgi:hypothetical protein
VPAAALSYLTSQLHIPPTAFARYDWAGRTGKRHRASIRTLLGFRPFSLRDAKPLRDWLYRDAVPLEHNPQHLREMALRRTAKPSRLWAPRSGSVSSSAVVNDQHSASSSSVQ